MTPTLRTMLVLVALAVVTACDALAVLLRAPAAALVGQIPLVALLLWMSHDLMRGRATPQLGWADDPVYQEAAKPPLTQDDYATLLRSDLRRPFSPTMNPSRVPGIYCSRCNRLSQQASIRHPIWDGPFDNAGSGVVDLRIIPWCLRCDGQPPSPAGRPVRLPYLDTEPIALLPELYERDAFHRLGQRVIKAPVLPPRPTHRFDSYPAGDGTICDICGYGKDDPRHG